MSHWWVLAYLLLEAGAGLLVVAIAVWGFFKWDRRYRGASGADGFQATDETFRDPTSGSMMRVFFNPTTGQRQYRESA
jgi:hypothetical protein